MRPGGRCRRSRKAELANAGQARLRHRRTPIPRRRDWPAPATEVLAASRGLRGSAVLVEIIRHVQAVGERLAHHPLATSRVDLPARSFRRGRPSRIRASWAAFLAEILASFLAIFDATQASLSASR